MPDRAISKNHLWHGGHRRNGMNRVAKRWKADLVDAFVPALLEQGIRHVECFTPPVHVAVTGAFPSRRSAPDMQNLLELACDAVEEATGINDREFTTSTGTPVYGVPVP